LAFDGSAQIDDLVEEMTEAAHTVRIGEVTRAIKDAKGKAGDIREGQIIGIVDDEEIEFIGEDVDAVAEQLASLLAEDAETLTLFAGVDYDDDRLKLLSQRISEAHPDLEVETHRGEQPLYPLVMSAE
jgi:dihydroxyacetone kinase-like predicted kinase